ncbi:hypothetical protein BOTCAL_0321g00030 [Botryotinia calthae]|uniref:Uncharacterized protein n=1 Tax=Botryotinia calthae TaxID=38488 RepID=A0A4Y8CTM5_9HELO|nr:hypothetical protein BOTCAL_0321g00030 [Botryotinia calthae]
MTSTNASSSTQVASTASLKSGPDSGSKKHRSHKSHDVSTNSSCAIVNSSSISAKGGKNTDSGNGSHQEKKSSHEPGTTSSQTSVSKPRPELKHASRSFLSRTKIDPKEKEKEKELKKEHKILQKQMHVDYTYVTAYNERNLEDLRYQLAKRYLEVLKNDPSTTQGEFEEQEEEVRSKRIIRNEADAKFEKIHKEDEETAGKQRELLRKMRPDSSYRIKEEKIIQEEEEKIRKREIKQAEKEERDKEAAKKAAKKADEAEQKRIAKEKVKEDEARRDRTARRIHNREEFEKSRYKEKKRERREN